MAAWITKSPVCFLLNRKNDVSREIFPISGNKNSYPDGKLIFLFQSEQMRELFCMSSRWELAEGERWFYAALKCYSWTAAASEFGSSKYNLWCFAVLSVRNNNKMDPLSGSWPLFYFVSQTEQGRFMSRVKNSWILYVPAKRISEYYLLGNC